MIKYDMPELEVDHEIAFSSIVDIEYDQTMKELDSKLDIQMLNNHILENQSEIERQLFFNPLSQPERNLPINENEFLEPCLRGGQKILNNPRKRELVKNIYRN